MANGNAGVKHVELIGIGPELPQAVSRRSVTEAEWRTLTGSLFPGAAVASVLMVVDYCRARKLDPLKKPCHIVPMEIKVGDKYEWRDVVMPGIYELRTTAQRTGEYLGHDEAQYGEVKECAGIQAPEWCKFTVYRWNPLAQMKAPYPVKVLFAEVVATKRDGRANSRWSKAPTQMLTKCAEAASLREAFPDEIGGEHTAEEMDGQRAADAPVEAKVIPPKPATYDERVDDLRAVADEGWTKFEDTFGKLDAAVRDWLVKYDNTTYETLKQRASAMEPQS